MALVASGWNPALRFEALQKGPSTAWKNWWRWRVYIFSMYDISTYIWIDTFGWCLRKQCWIMVVIPAAWSNMGYGSAKVSALRRLTSLNHLKLSLKPDPWHKPCGKLANFGGSVLSTRKINLHAQFHGVRSCPSKLPGNCEEILCRSLLSWMENSTTTKSHVTNG